VQVAVTDQPSAISKKQRQFFFMRNLPKHEIVKNVGSNWFALGLNMVIGLFLSPFILHKLGDTAFGLWVLIFSLTGYYGIFEFGIRSSIIRYVSKYTATHDREELNGLINTAMFTYTCLGVVCMLITAVGCLYIDRLFHIAPDFLVTARWLLFMVGTSVALSFPLGVSGGMLEGLQKFYVLDWTNIAFSSVLRVILIVFYLKRGCGLLTIAFISVALPVVSAVMLGVVALRALPVKFSWKHVNRNSLRIMVNHSGVTFAIIVAQRLRFKTDAVVIGGLLSSAAITYFYAGSRLVDYAGEVVSGLAQIFVPMSSQSDAAGNMDRLRKIFVVGNRACALTIFPITVIFIILGKSIIEVWVGKKYVAQGYPVLLTLILPYTLMLMQAASGRILMGMSKHGTLAVVILIEGIANLVLSILLVRPFGILGDAFGTAIPLLGTFIFFMPAHLCSRLGVRLTTFVRQAYLLPLTVCAPMIVVLLLLRSWQVPHTYRQLAVQLVAAGLVYCLSLLWAHATNRTLHVEDLSLAIETPSEIPAPVIKTFQEDV
jgi:O-antigen/teichoic acid export membrane protein